MTSGLSKIRIPLQGAYSLHGGAFFQRREKNEIQKLRGNLIIDIKKQRMYQFMVGLNR
jgi:hypothetical protein